MATTDAAFCNLAVTRNFCVWLSATDLAEPLSCLTSSTSELFASSSLMAPAPSSVLALPANFAFDGPDNRRITVSFASFTLSPLTVTATVLLVSSGAKVSVPPAGSA